MKSKSERLNAIFFWLPQQHQFLDTYIFFNVVQAFHKLHISPNNKQLPQFQSSDNDYTVYLVKHYYSPVPNPERLKSSLNFLIL